jgi:hypothetical protein
MKPEIVEKLDAFIAKFEGLFKKYEIDMVGYWFVEGDESDQYLLFKYESEEEIKEKFDILLKDSEYLTLREEISEYRLSFEETRLKSKWIPE